MKRVLLVITALVLALSCAACTAARDDLKFYVLTAAQAAGSTTDDALLSLAKREGRVAFTGSDLQGWLWADQRVRVKKARVLGAASSGSPLFQAAETDVFVLALNGRVLYTGGFAPAGTLAAAPRAVYIRDEGGGIFSVCYDEKYGEGDPRAGNALYRFLRDRQLLASTLDYENVS